MYVVCVEACGKGQGEGGGYKLCCLWVMEGVVNCRLLAGRGRECFWYQVCVAKRGEGMSRVRCVLV